ncbi:MAG: hypothetical protein AB7O44_33150, partial [Hyphomicrobiaceae bacterium]
RPGYTVSASGMISCEDEVFVAEALSLSRSPDAHHEREKFRLVAKEILAGEGPSAREAARAQAWRWFEFHAQQRLTVFKFFMTGYAALAGAAGAIVVGAPEKGIFLLPVIGLVALVLCRAFRRLDMRCAELTKLGEAYLREDQKALAEKLGSPEINLVERAEKKEFKGRAYQSFCSFTEVNSAIFRVGSILAIALLLSSTTLVLKDAWLKFDKGSMAVKTGFPRDSQPKK